jgi:hypothetical protein
MMALIRQGRQWEEEEHWLSYMRDDGSGYLFAADPWGFAIWERLTMAGRESLAYCETGALGKPAGRTNRRFRREPDVYACPGGCGREVEFYGYSATVDYCFACEERLQQEYPQGWRYYPGDVCPHGVYVGGCGIDWMCGACEAGA